MDFESNPQLELVYEYVCYTGRCIFLTGKAGTGKTTFLHRIKKEPVKRMIVVAPTGVAAINAGGMTIHSFFQLPFGPFLPGNTREMARQRKFSGEKIKLIRSLDLLVIDEISMVRADMLDGVDTVLRRYKNPLQPFGGVQLLMIGDLHQLPPVVKEEEWSLLRAHYETPYFFSSNALRQAQPLVVELKKVYRQSDASFIELLNKVRDHQIDEQVLNTLNSRFDPTFESTESDGYITLTTHNSSAKRLNAQKLSALSGSNYLFTAQINKDFPASAYPTEEKLNLKVGAQVMFVKNDPTPEKRFFNGKIGKITLIKEDEIKVLCQGDRTEIVVETLVWENVKYTLNEETREVSEDVVGSFTQYPLKLAWAITIHKSQGLTFERVVLDAQAAFAHGQVYVALSRCKSFEGIVLRSKIISSSVKTDTVVRHFTKEAEKNAPDQAQLEASKRTYQQTLLLELFGFVELKKGLEQMDRILLEYENSFQPEAHPQFRRFADLMESDAIGTSAKFGMQIRRLAQNGGLPEENEALQERIQKAGAWFLEQLDTQWSPLLNKFKLQTDNRKLRKRAGEILENIQKEIFTKRTCFALAAEGFSTHQYLQIKARAVLDFQASRQVATPSFERDLHADIRHPELYIQLQQWREDLAKSKGSTPHSLLPTRTLFELVQHLPQSEAALKKIKGIGKGRARQFGAELIGLIRAYCTKFDLLSTFEETSEKPKVNTKAQSLELYRQGKNITEIAEERSLKPVTIEGHLAHFIGLGELSIFDLMSKTEVQKMETYYSENPEASLSEAKAYFGDAVSYGQLKMYLEHQKLS